MQACNGSSPSDTLLTGAPPHIIIIPVLEKHMSVRCRSAAFSKSPPSGLKAAALMHVRLRCSADDCRCVSLGKRDGYGLAVKVRGPQPRRPVRMCGRGGPIGGCSVEKRARWQLMADGLDRERRCSVQGAP